MFPQFHVDLRSWTQLPHGAILYSFFDRFPANLPWLFALIISGRNQIHISAFIVDFWTTPWSVEKTNFREVKEATCLTRPSLFEETRPEFNELRSSAVCTR